MSRSRFALPAFGVMSAVHLVGEGIGSHALQWITKPLLMPALAVYSILSGKKRSKRLLVALGLATAGDVAMEVGALIPGMLLFLGAYGTYARAFVRRGALERLRRWPGIAVALGYAAYAAAMLSWLWPGLSARGLAWPMAVYAAVLATMAATAATQGPRVAIGAALLVCSDTLIGMRIAGVPPLPGPPVWVMATYLLGQALIVTGWPEEAKTSTADYAKVAA